jgi:hypothetical protein
MIGEYNLHILFNDVHLTAVSTSFEDISFTFKLYSYKFKPYAFNNGDRLHAIRTQLLLDGSSTPITHFETINMENLAAGSYLIEVTI